MYKYDIHVHTSETSACSKISAEDAVRMYKEAGYQGIVITDHFHSRYFEKFSELSWKEKVDRFFGGFKIALNKGKEIGLDVFPGMEITFLPIPNDFLVYGLEPEMLYSRPGLYETELYELYEFAQKNDLLIYQAHPFRKNQFVADIKYLDGIEVYNGNPRHDSNNSAACEFAKRHNLSGISGSDFHQTEDLALGGIAVKKKLIDIHDLKNVLRKNEYQLLYGDE